MATRELCAPRTPLGGVRDSHWTTGYLLLGLISTFVFRAVRDTLPNNPTAQERILGASFTALALADVSLNPPIREHMQTDLVYTQVTQ